MSSRAPPRRPPLRNILTASLLLLTQSATCQQEDDSTSSILAGVSACGGRAGPLPCLLRAAERALRTDRWPLPAGASLESRAQPPPPAVAPGDDAAQAEGGAEAEVQTEAGAEAAEAGGRRPGAGLLRRLAALLSARSLQLRLPGAALLPEGRGKGGGLKKYGSVLLLGAMMKAAVLAIAFKGISLLAGGALLVAKLAFVLAAVVGLGKLLGGGGGDSDKPAVEYVKQPALAHAYGQPAAHEYGHGGAGAGAMHYEPNGADGGVARWRRSLLGADAHALAYSARAHHLS